MFLIIISIIYFLFPRQSFAINEFSISQKVVYSVDIHGKARVKQNISLVNNFSQIYAKEYQIKLSGSNISNISGNDLNGNIIEKIEQKNDTTNIFLNFNKPIIGKNQANQFSLNYDINNFANRKGNTWEIQFPIYSINSENEQISIILEVPTTFGELSFSSIPINNFHTVGNINQLQINSNQLYNKKGLLVFGNHQLFDFKLNYFLKNSKDTDIYTEIPIPPDTNNQTIILQSIDPPPTSIKTDVDGNWLAQFYIPPQKSLNITVIGQAKIHPPVFKEKNIDIDSLTSEQKYWPTTNSKITSISKNLSTPKSIYQFVINNLDYNYQEIDSATRKGALWAIENPSLSVCTEFTDLFVTLARSKDIPSREIEGYAHSNNPKIKPTNADSDVLHAWPEYYDNSKKDWIQIDPTWEKTTNGIDYFTDLDLNHLTFVIHGVNSEYPPPPGSYKNEKNTKSVFVDFANTEIKPKYTSPGLSISNNKLTIKNSNLFSIHLINLKSDFNNWQYSVDFLPPLGSIIINVPKMSFFQSILPQNSKYLVTLTTKESVTPITYRLINNQHYLNISICIGICIILLCIGGIILTTSSKKNEKNS